MQNRIIYDHLMGKISRFMTTQIKSYPPRPKWRRLFIKSAVFCVIAYGFSGLALQEGEGFTTLEISTQRPYNPDFETGAPTSQEWEEIQCALSQNYTYFGCGGQAFALFSEDQKYVIKFFKQRHFWYPEILKKVPGLRSYSLRKLAKRKRRLYQEYGSYTTAFNQFREFTQLLYVHLNPTNHINIPLKVVDKLGIHHTIHLDPAHFILQRRAFPVAKMLTLCARAHRYDFAQQILSSLVTMIKTRCLMGYGDHDANIATNCGVVNGKVVKIDVGRFFEDPRKRVPILYKAEMWSITRPLYYWLKEKHPPLVPILNTELYLAMYDD